jgi:hypothetical protein
MPSVHLTRHLYTFYPQLEGREIVVEASTVGEVVQALERLAPGIGCWHKASRPEQGIHFGFPITADAKDGRTAWVVPGKSDIQRITVNCALFVARTKDGGETWQELRRGLPQQEAYDVVYRHALANKDGAVAFGSTTGNLYVSDDGGDHWTTVTTNLPPIYSVRFA